jgi:peroxiredoxin
MRKRTFRSSAMQRLAVARVASRTCCWGGLLALVVALSSSVLLFADDDDPELLLAPLFTLRNLDGDEVSLIDFRGKAVILDFWASWCLPCTRALPDIHALVEANKTRGLVLLLLCFDKHEEDARNYLIEHEHTTHNVLYGSLDETRAVKELYGVDAVTHTILIDADGVIRYSGHPMWVTYELIEPWLSEPEDESDPPDSEPSPCEESTPDTAASD